MIKSFECENFRNVSCNELDLARINILIGPNNAGKSNFIRALSFAANMMRPHPSETSGFLSELKRNGWDAVINRQADDKHSFKLVWKFELMAEHPVVYTLKVHTGSRRGDNYIEQEALDSEKSKEGFSQPYNFFECHSSCLGKGEFSTAGMQNKQNRRLKAEVNPNESVLRQMDNLFFENKEMFSTLFVRENIRDVLESMRKYFRGFYSYSCTAFNITAIREMQDEQADGEYLQKDGSNFVNVFVNAEEKDVHFKDRFCDALKKLGGNCTDVRIKKGGGKIWMEIKIDDCCFPLSEVSDGTIHLLLLLLMLNLPEDGGISMLAIDEPEMNLHPAWQKMLAAEILRCPNFKQCFISTHSSDFLDEFTEEFLEGNVNVFVFDSSSRVSLRLLNREELRTELSDWTLGDLYRIGDPVIGGWPQ